MGREIVEKVRDAGIVGAGGAGFPTHVKLDTEVERVLGNGASCEPLLMSDPYLMEHETESVLRGLVLTMEATRAGKGSICIKGKHTGAVRALRDALSKGAFDGVDLVELEDFYPAGDEHVLVYDMMNRVVPEGGIPLQVGAVVSNVESLRNVAAAVDRQEPVTDRYLTVCGEVARPMILKAPLGTRIGDILHLAGGATVNPYRILIGGPMMGKVVDDPATPVTKTTSGVILLPADHNVIVGKTNDPDRIRRITQMVCCQCTRCTDLCPRHLLGHSLEPHKIMRQLGAPGGLSLELMEDALICSECGICEKYACPMMISPREVNAQIKQELMSQGVRRSPSAEAYNPSAFRDLRKIPTLRLMDRLKVRAYDVHPEFMAEPIQVGEVSIPLSQHIGAPAEAVVKKGDRVRRGDLVGKIPEKALGAAVHASIDGVVTGVNDAVTIKR
jgi:Na+-translocating ferredoxin:NAD+ oxidoreductase RnfC subunit